jgi:hypothetical protein
MFAILCGCVLAAADPTKESGPPVVFEFSKNSGPAKGRKEAYDPKAKRYHLLVRDIARFKVKAVAGDLDKRPVVLEIGGMLDKPEGPLTLHVGGKQYVLSPEKHDVERFRVARQAGVTTIEFLPKGKELLRPGAMFQYIDFFRR